MARRTPGPDERQRDPERTRQQILDAGLAEFAAKGYAGARVGDIAERAGVNKQLISYYFGGKDGLYRAVGELWWEYESAELQVIDNLPEQVRQYAIAGASHGQSARLLAWEGLAYTGTDGDVDSEERDRRLRQNAELIKEAHAAGRLDSRFDPMMLMLIFLSAANAPAVYPQLVRGLTGETAESPEFIGRFADQLGLVAELLLSEADDTERA
ncbi:TetR/AcrR family transcriptional regulator [Microlunatus speluncae]|uniref:TetR/AcrR family transcriptional regulator n=1 Tax=Microlunatus speluncae TaxID=2594267 RepID=UPI0012666F40|nr:TetR/AcrR family transcriptional regulator [Microlunatus speluncae]